MQSWQIRVAGGACEVRLGEPLEDVIERVGPRRVLVVTDSNVRAALGERLGGFDAVEVGLGEGAKTLATVEALYEAFLDRRLDRSSLVLGVGGGIVTDLAGFAAATFHRGLPFAFAPTSLLAQVDAALGGKNGVNFRAFKNLVGLIRQPEFVHIDPSVLATLPLREWRCGLSEVVKAAAVRDGALFARLEAQAEGLLATAPTAPEDLISAAVGVKLALVQEDETEQGPRTLLNFGHTLGHVLERAAGLAHGEAVAVGMVAASRLSVALGLLEAAAHDRLVALLMRLGLPVTASPEALREALAHLDSDKKRRGAELRWVLLAGLGRGVVHPLPLPAAAGLLGIRP